MAEPLAFQQRQRAFAAHIRNPDANPRPRDVEDRRMAIYRELFYNNVSELLAVNFPVLHKILADDHWHSLVRDFFARHRCRTPHFPEIAQEFLRYLQGERGEVQRDPPFLLELTHYEWVELALMIDPDDGDTPAADPNGDLLARPPVVSPLAWNLTYRWPVHRIGPEFLPEEPEETHLVVYRDREDQVLFLEINPITQRLLELLKENPATTGLQAVSRIAEELSHPDPRQVIEAGRLLLLDLRERNIILGTAA